MRFVAVAQAIEHLDGVFGGRFIDIDRGKTALEGGILLDVFVELIERGCARYKNEQLHKSSQPVYYPVSSLTRREQTNSNVDGKLLH